MIPAHASLPVEEVARILSADRVAYWAEVLAKYRGER